MKRDETPKYETDQLSLAAALILFSGIFPELINMAGRVIFTFPSEDRIFKALQKYHEGAEGSIILYAKRLKRG